MNEDYGFDRFLLEKWRASEDGDSEKERRAACRRFQKALRDKNVAAPGTIRAWFGLGKKSEPNREKMVQLAFALRLRTKELDEYLQKGLRMPGIQVNDYRELIYYYGLEHEMEMQECDRMILVFEKHMCRAYVPLQETHTVKLWKYYESWHEKDPVHFLKEMCVHAEMFKGYSKTTLDHFKRLKTELLQDIRHRIRENLTIDLRTLGYPEEISPQTIEASCEKEKIHRFLKNISRHVEVKNNPAKQALIQSVRRDCSVVYSGHERNRDLLRELYSPAVSSQSGKVLFSKKNKRMQTTYGLSYMTERHISDLVGISIQKEREIRLAQAIACLSEETAEDICPEWIRKMIETEDAGAAGQKQEYAALTVEQARKLLVKMHQQQRTRCLLIQREDLLPLIMEVARRKYCRQQEKLGEKPDPKEARRYFSTMANTILADCSMAPLDERYALDKLLLESFGGEVVECFADLLEDDHETI